jgi:hypothetical protein
VNGEQLRDRFDRDLIGRPPGELTHRLWGDKNLCRHSERLCDLDDLFTTGSKSHCGLRVAFAPDARWRWAVARWIVHG